MPTRAEYAKINIACKELGIDKHQLLLDRYGLATSKDLSRRQTWDLLAHLKRLGWQAKPGRKAARPSYTEAQKRKIAALWRNLADAGVVREPGERGLNRYVKRMTGVDRLQWCDAELTNRVCQSLVEWCKRTEVKHEA
jgi:phage gp16-like protein